MLRQKIVLGICYLAICLFIWLSIGQILFQVLSENQLTKTDGTISKIESIAVRERKSLSESSSKIDLRINLQETEDYFIIPYTFNYELLSDKIPESSKAEIYTRPSWLIPFTLGAANYVVQLKIDGETVLSFQEVKNKNRPILIILLVAIPVFILLTVWLKNRFKKRRT